MADRQRRIPEDPDTGHRYGRHVNHDPRSLRYKVAETATPATHIWERKIPVLDQGNLGSCTANATVGVLGTEPFYSQLTPVQRQALNEDEAVRLYSLATELDPFDGTYKPDDTGSDGLSVAKAAVKFGYLSGYQHITSVAAAHTAIASGPFIVGTAWLEGMETPNANGVVQAAGAELGGHEYECFGYDAATDLWWFWNSWSDQWGKGGAFAYSSATFAKLLANQGDATVFVPVTQPAPVPTPEPAPVEPEPVDNAFPAAEYEAWRAHQFSIGKRKAFITAMDTYLGRTA